MRVRQCASDVAVYGSLDFAPAAWMAATTSTELAPCLKASWPAFTAAYSASPFVLVQSIPEEVALQKRSASRCSRSRVSRIAFSSRAACASIRMSLWTPHPCVCGMPATIRHGFSAQRNLHPSTAHFCWHMRAGIQEQSILSKRWPAPFTQNGNEHKWLWNCVGVIGGPPMSVP